jgi:hypothetical protein
VSIFRNLRLKGGAVQQPITTAIERLVLAGEQAGFSVEQMIQLLETGASADALLSLIEMRLFPSPPRSSRWII